MKIEKLFPNSQFEHWLNVQVARHLQAQAATFRPADHRQTGEYMPVESCPAKEDVVRA